MTIYTIMSILILSVSAQGEYLKNPYPLELVSRSWENEYDGRDTLNMTLTGTWPFGSANWITIKDSIAFLAVGAGVYVLDINTPSSPTKIGEIRTIWGIQGLCVDSNYLYMHICQKDSIDPGLFLVFDISNPSSPVKMGTCHLPDMGYLGGGIGIDAKFPYVYVSRGYAGLRIIDVSDPNSPYEIGYTDFPCYPVDVEVRGQYAYVAHRNGALDIVDISDPARPDRAGMLDFQGGGSYSVALIGSHAFVVHHGGSASPGFRVVDISDPTNPYEVWSLWGEVLPCVDADSPYVYLTVNYYNPPNFISSLTTYDMSDPTSPVLVATTPTFGSDYFRSLCKSGDCIYTAHQAGGFYVVDVSVPASPSIIGHFDTPGLAERVHIDNNYAYIVNKPHYAFGGTSRLWILDVSDKTYPLDIAHYNPITGVVYDVWVQGNYAYLAEAEGGVEAIDVSVPSSPIHTDNIDTYCAYGIFVSDTFAYVADYYGLKIIDISDPSSLTLAGEWVNTNIKAEKVWVQNSYAYLALYTGLYGGGLSIVDVSDPTNPIFAGASTNVDIYGNDICVQGGYAYVASGHLSGWGYCGLCVFDVSNPASPSWEAFLPLGISMGVRVFDTLAYVTTVDRGIRMISISDPLSPVEKGYYNVSGWGYGVDIDISEPEPYVYLAYGPCGLFIFEGPIIGVAEKKGAVNPFNSTFTVSPNPFSKSTVISYSSLVINYQLPVTNDLQCPALRIYDATGRLVKQFDHKTIGLSKRIAWNGTDDLGRRLPAGVYFLQLETEKLNQTKKVVLLD